MMSCRFVANKGLPLSFFLFVSVYFAVGAAYHAKVIQQDLTLSI